MSLYNIDTYKSMLSRAGTSMRDRRKSVFQRDILTDAPNDIAYKSITVNGADKHVIINSTSDYTIKEVVSMPGESIALGSIVTFCGIPWIVHTRDFDDEVYGKCKMRQCNAVLKWKDTYDVTHVYDGYADDATKYSEGVIKGKVNIGEFQIKVIVPLDGATSLIQRDMRFIIDAESYIDNIVSADARPYVFRVTRRNVVTGTYSSEGYVEITLVEDMFVDERDDYTNMTAAQPNELKAPAYDAGTTDVSTESGWL